MATNNSYSFALMSKKIILAFGGVRPMAVKMSEALPGKNLAPTTVQYWWEQGYIPIKRQPDVSKAARFHGIKIEPADFAFTGEAA